MLAEWLEKEAQSTMVKTAAQQFENELAALDTPSIAKMWRDAKKKEAAAVPMALGGALGGGLAGGLYGGAAGGLGGALAAQPGERGEGFWQGAKAGLAPGAVTGAIGGGVAGGMMGAAARPVPGGYAIPAGAAQDARTIAALSQLGGGVGGGIKGYTEVEGKAKKKKEKKSSVDILRLAMRRLAQR